MTLGQGQKRALSVHELGQKVDAVFTVIGAGDPVAMAQSGPDFGPRAGQKYGHLQRKVSRF